MLGVTLGAFYVLPNGVPDVLPATIIEATMIVVNLIVFGWMIPRRSISGETQKVVLWFYLIVAFFGSLTYFLGLFDIGFIPITLAFNRFSWFLYLSFLNNALPAYVNEDSYEKLLTAVAILINFTVALTNWFVYRTACRKHEKKNNEL